jgi:hypothetical protein
MGVHLAGVSPHRGGPPAACRLGSPSLDRLFWKKNRCVLAKIDTPRRQDRAKSRKPQSLPFSGIGQVVAGVRSMADLSGQGGFAEQAAFAISDDHAGPCQCPVAGL